MNKLFTLLLLIFVLKVDSDYVDDNYSDIINCIYKDTDSCSSVHLKTKNMECCLFEITFLKTGNNYYGDYPDTPSEICNAVFTSYVSNNMMKQIESIAIEDYGILKAYLDIDIPRIRANIKCSSASANYELGGYSYSSTDLAKLKSKNHCLYYYYNSIGENLFTDTTVSISKDKCINAESLDVTKSADIYCAYADVAILYSDNTKKEFKTCYFLPSESIKSKKLDPTTEAALNRLSQNEAQKDGKTISEYEAKLVDKNGRSITYNSIDGIVDTSNAKNIYGNYYKLILFSLCLLL